MMLALRLAVAFLSDLREFVLLVADYRRLGKRV